MQSAEFWYKEDAQLKSLEFEKYSKTASKDTVEKTKTALEAKKYVVKVVDTKADALEAIKSLVPKGSSVMNAGSTTLSEIGLTEFMKGETGWDNFQQNIC
ncbi:MAG: hypothetical protein SGCHY_005551 [Lobulomycetales sp.]